MDGLPVTAGATLAIYAAPDAGTAAVAEWIRVLAALVACGEAPVVAVLPGGTLDPDALTADAARTLETLLELGIEPRPYDPAALVAAAATARRILRVGAPTRNDDIFCIDDAALTAARHDPAAFVAHLATAGQALRSC